MNRNRRNETLIAYNVALPILIFYQDRDTLTSDVSKDESSVPASRSVKKPSKKKRDGSTLRKAPQAPKRFKSSYICFFMAKQQEIKESLTNDTTVTQVSKRSAEMWRTLPVEERAYWDDVAAKDKARYMAEKATYTGPWQVPWKRAKKDPSAPKRPMSAFLYFSQEKRRGIKEKNPGMRNTEVSRVLGEMWRSAAEDERNPHIFREAKERKKYKIAIAEWRVENEASKEAEKTKLEAQRKAQTEQIAYQNASPPGPVGDPGQGENPFPGNMQYDPNAPQNPAYNMGGPVPYNYMPHYGPMYQAQYPSNPHYQSGSSSKHMVLGPNGMPQSPMYNYGPPPQGYPQYAPGHYQQPPQYSYDQEREP
mmetsp:Transcript_26414/g.47903  ORF Transcript_26414/g.47903 Transcript_26414/m.47903 type:complete len:364 (+) Transcript_26414:341-1432(+)